MADSMAVVDRMYECFGKGDMDTLKSDVFAQDIVWKLPGHHPLSGDKKGADEVIAFFAALIKTGVVVKDVSFGTIGDNKVVEQHTGHGTVEGREYHESGHEEPGDEALDDLAALAQQLAGRLA